MKNFLTAVISVFCLVAISGCTAVEPPELLTPVGMGNDTAVVTRDTVSVSYYFNSAVVPYVESMYFENEGIISNVYFALGDSVKAGDVLYELDTEELNEQISNTEEQIAYNKKMDAMTIQGLELDIQIAQAEYDKLLRINAEAAAVSSVMQSSSVSASSTSAVSSAPIVSSSVSIPSSSVAAPSSVSSSSSASSSSTVQPSSPPISQSQLVLALSDLNSALTKLAQAVETQLLIEKQLNSKLATLRASSTTPRITSPIDGVVVYTAGLVKGDSVEPYINIVSVADNSRVFLTGDFVSVVTAENAVKSTALIDGSEYEIEYIPIPTEELFALQLAEREIFSSFSILSPDTNLQVGQFAVIEIYTEIAENVLTLPINAVNNNDLIGDYVFIVEEDGRLTSRPITSGVKNDIKVEIVEGLEEGDIIYVQR